MKRTSLKLLSLASFMLAVSVCATRADVPSFINTFDNSSSFVFTTTAGANYSPPPYTIRPDWTNSFTGIVATNVVWSTSNDTALNASSGSMRFDFVGISSTTNTTNNLSAAAWTMDIVPNTISTNTIATAVSFDIMVDKGSVTDSSGGFGNFVVILRDASYDFPTNTTTFTNYNEELGNPSFSTSNNLAGTWEHILITGSNGLPDATHITAGQTNRISAVTFQWFFTGHNLNGNVTCYVDNLVIYTNGVETPPTMSVAKYTGVKGVLNATLTPNGTADVINNSDGTYYQRQDIRTTAATYSWLSSADTASPSGGGHGPTNAYSITITNYPPPANSNVATYLMVIAGTPNEANPDWVESNVVNLVIVNNADGTATGTLRFKVFDPGDNAGYNGSAGNYSTGFLATASTPSPLGTWTIQFDHSTNVSLIPPGGSPITTNMPYIDNNGLLEVGGLTGDIYYSLGQYLGAYCWKGACEVYVGCLPNRTNNIGQTVVFSGIEITSNSVPLVNETFQNTLNPNTWTVCAEDPAGISSIPGFANYVVSWTLPDAGFALGTNANLTAVNSWANPNLSSAPVNGKRSAYSPDYGKTFYRLQYILSHK